MASLGRYDLFFTSSDGATVEHRTATATTNVATVLSPQRTQFSTSTTQRFAVGSLARITDSTTSPATTALCRVTAPNQSAANVTLLPIASALNTEDPIGHTFPGGSTVTSDETMPSSAVRLIVDLRSASEDSIQYVVGASASLSAEGIGDALHCWVNRSDDFDPLGTDKYGHARITMNAQAGASSYDDSYQYTQFSHHVLAAGRVYTFDLYFSGETAGKITRADNARMFALRIGSGAYIAGDGKTAETIVGSGYPTSDTHVEHATNAIPSGDYMIFASYCARTTATSGVTSPAEATLDNYGDISVSDFASVDAADYYPFAFAGIATIDGALNRLRLLIENRPLGGNAYMRHGSLFVVPLDQLAIASQYNSISASGFADTSGDQWAELESSADLTPAGTQPDAIRLSFAALTLRRVNYTDRWQLRPEFDGDATRGLHGYTLNGSDPGVGIAWFHRVTTQSPTAPELAIQMRTPDDLNGGRLYWDNLYFTDLNETPVLSVRQNSDVRILVEAERAHIVKHGFGVGSGVDYDYDTTTLPDVRDVSRFIVAEGGERTEFTRATTAPASAEQWQFYDAAQRLDVNWFSPSTFAPDDDDVYPIVVAAERLSSEHTVLTSEENEPLGPVGAVRSLDYAPRIVTTPTIGAALTTSQGSFGSAGNIGSLSLASADRRFLPMISGSLWQGWALRVIRGYANLSLERADYETIARGVQGQATYDAERGLFSLSIFDRSVDLLLAAATETVTSYRDGSANTIQEKTQMPVIYGTVRNVPAFRITQNVGATDYNNYQMVGHAISSVSRVRVEPDGTPIKKAATQGWQANSGHLDAGMVTVANNADLQGGSSTDAFADAREPPDMVYCDIVGRTEVASGAGASAEPALTSPGKLLIDLLTTYGKIAPSDIERSSFDALDRSTWDRQPARSLRQDGKVQHAPMDVGLICQPDEAVVDALRRFSDQCGVYLAINRQGRFSVRTPDLGLSESLIANPSFEEDNSFPWLPEYYGGFAYLSRTTSAAAIGGASLQVTNWLAAGIHAATRVALPEPGTYCITFLVLGNASASNLDDVRVEIVDPSGATTLTDPLDVSVTQWSRVTIYHEASRGSVGQTEFRIYPNHGDTALASIWCDGFMLVRCAAVLDEANSKVVDVEIDPESYREVSAGFAAPYEGGGNVDRLIFTDTDLSGSLATQTEVEASTPDSGTLALADTRHRTAISVAGLNAPVLAYYRRPRLRLGITIFEYDRIPELGEFVAVKDQRFAPVRQDRYPLWRIIAVQFDGASSLNLVVEQQAETISDQALKIT